MSDSAEASVNTGVDDRSVTEQVHELKDQIVEGYHDIEETYLTARDQAYEVNRKAVVFIREHPGACIAGAFAIGFVIGKLAQKRWLV